jgi:two-component sensor histidine kinase
MASLAEIARSYTRVEGTALAHLQRLTAAWGLLADFCFSDLLLFAPVAGSDSKFVILGQMRPTTSQTLYREDQVGTVVDDVDRPLVARAWRLGQIVDGENKLDPQRERSRVQCIPVRWKDAMVGVMTRESVPSVGRRPGELERVYIEIFDRFARMIATGEFPFGAADIETEDAPRVGDGVLLLDEFARIEYASPNAVSALHRIGIHSNLEGARLSELKLEESPVRVAFAIGLPITEEMERGPVTLLLRAIPLIEHRKISGAVVLLRDVSELRRRDRLLISKDATIREVHHRVKNNLQTISALLRLQGRRLESEEAIAALEEAVRRIRSIALVHETLSRASGEEVEFNEILRPLVRMVEEGLLSPDRPVRITVEGDAGQLRAEVATPLAVVLTELLQNAVQHAFPDGADRGEGPKVQVTIAHEHGDLVVHVLDNGVGLPAGFSVDDATSLGLTIVRALVTSELGGTIGMRTDGGTHVDLRIPMLPQPDPHLNSLQ